MKRLTGLFFGCAVACAAPVEPPRRGVDPDAAGGAGHGGETTVTGGHAGSAGAIVSGGSGGHAAGSGGSNVAGAGGHVAGAAGSGGSIAAGSAGSGGSITAGSAGSGGSITAGSAGFGGSITAGAGGSDVAGSAGSPTCGNGVVDTDDFESCDGANLGDFTCAIVAPTSTGALACSPRCQLDTSGCSIPLSNGDTSGYDPGAPWPCAGAGPARASRSLAIGPHALTKPKWTFTQSAEIDAAVIAADGTIFTSSHNSSVIAINPDGTQLWKKPFNGAAPPVLGANGDIYVGSDVANVAAFHRSGALAWTFPAPSAPGFVSVAPDGTIYAKASDGMLYAITTTGSQKWAVSVGDGGGSGDVALAADGTILTAQSQPLPVPPPPYPSGALVALHPSDGSVAWTFPTPQAVWSTPTVAPDGTIYFGCEDRSIYALNPNGTLKWSSPIGFTVRDLIAIGPDLTLYVAAQGATVDALDPTDGSVKWTYPVTVGGSGGPIVGGDGTLYFETWDAGGVVALSPGGDFLSSFAFPSGGGFAQVSLGADGTLYVPSAGGDLFAFAAH